ncbi:inner membrane protein YqaA [mine drainage metagenome]|uniref:Inner membrane protein YqaA n=1 Tax=mine drainage metagenome TaxID=410659 RepID=A0A1J5PMH6_9ZZZZ
MSGLFGALPSDWLHGIQGVWAVLLHAASGTGGLVVLALVSFAAATLIPLSSEAVLLAVVAAQPRHALAAVLVATAANTAGGMTTYALGRWARRWQTPDTWRWAPRVQRWGAPITVWAWLPGVGDALVAASGWLRIDPWACAAWMTLGRGLRYVAVAGLAWAM